MFLSLQAIVLCRHRQPRRLQFRFEKLLDGPEWFEPQPLHEGGD